ncbi:hypothetical protein AQUCO_00400122v1 [Aquilegia coerulea]|uniref:Uncharacterized protein n=1 Tax=Aquilegia coerulea TaxID=218851 RepID=A0A2G5ETH0_AQUCA|nr:hypothetical protein AQUCO_00400122v1 [Aquilegia coerulea]
MYLLNVATRRFFYYILYFFFIPKYVQNYLNSSDLNYKPFFFIVKTFENTYSTTVKKWNPFACNTSCQTNSSTCRPTCSKRPLRCLHRTETDHEDMICSTKIIREPTFQDLL